MKKLIESWAFLFCIKTLSFRIVAQVFNENNMDIKALLAKKREEYIATYGRTPNTLFLGNNLFSEVLRTLGDQSLYEATPKHLWGADVIMVLTPDHVKFAEHSDVRMAAKTFQNDRTWGEYAVRKHRTSVGGGNSGDLVKSETTELDPIIFTSEELDIYLMQS